jgi:hypothetical protein
MLPNMLPPKLAPPVIGKANRLPIPPAIPPSIEPLLIDLVLPVLKLVLIALLRNAGHVRPGDVAGIERLPLRHRNLRPADQRVEFVDAVPAQAHLLVDFRIAGRVLEVAAGEVVLETLLANVVVEAQPRLIQTSQPALFLPAG